MDIRRSYDRLISTMGYPILVRWHLYIELGARLHLLRCWRGNGGITWTKQTRSMVPNAANLSRYVRYPWWRHRMETFSALLALCTGNATVTSEFLSQRPVTQSFGVFFDLRLQPRIGLTHFDTLWHIWLCGEYNKSLILYKKNHIPQTITAGSVTR